MALFYAKVHKMAIKTFRDEKVKRSSIMVYMDLARHCNAKTCVLHNHDIKDIAENTGLSNRRVYSAPLFCVQIETDDVNGVVVPLAHDIQAIAVIERVAFHRVSCLKVSVMHSASGSV